MLNSKSLDSAKPSFPEGKNQQNILNLNNIFLDQIDFLQAIQVEFRNKISINKSGMIDRKSLEEVNKVFGGNDLIKKMNQAALDHYNLSRDDFRGISDCTIIGGTLICIYNSSIFTPNRFKNSSRGDHKNYSNFSVIGIDCNESNRTDKVSPDISLHHEFQHHLNTTLGDKILLNNPDLKFFSVERYNDPPFGFQSKSRFVAEKDAKIIETLFGHSINLQSSHPAIKTPDYTAYENQLYYLDELSASWGQEKSNVFGPKMKFYNNIMQGDYNHYEIIGDSENDRNDLKKLFSDYLMPGIYLFELVKLIQNKIDELSSLKFKDKIEQSINEFKIKEFELKKENINHMICLITQTIGVSRTVHQALELISNVWENKILPYLSENHKKYIYSGGEQLKSNL